MDVEVIPSSNPYAWLRLTPAGLRKVIEDNFSEGELAETWVERAVKRARKGDKQRFPNKMVETITDVLPPEYYRVGEEVRSVKRDFGQRKGAAAASASKEPADPENALFSLSQHEFGPREGVAASASGEPADSGGALKHLKRVSKWSPDPILRSAAQSLQEYLQ